MAFRYVYFNSNYYVQLYFKTITHVQFRPTVQLYTHISALTYLFCTLYHSCTQFAPASHHLVLVCAHLTLERHSIPVCYIFA